MADGRNIELKRIENKTRSQVMYSKRRTDLIEKAREISICCDVDVMVVTFSQAGRVSMFCNKERIEDVLGRYIYSPSYQRYKNSDIKNIERKLQRLEQLSHINGDYSKMQFLENQIENLRLHIQKRELELQIAKHTLKNYEIDPNDSLDRLSSCERNLKISLQKVAAKRECLLQKEILMELQNIISQATNSSTLSGNAMRPGLISPDMVHENIFQDMFNPWNQMTNFNPGPSTTPNFPIQESLNPSMPSNVQVPPPNIPIEHPLMVDQPLLNLQDQMNAEALMINDTSSNANGDEAVQISNDLRRLEEWLFDDN